MERKHILLIAEDDPDDQFLIQDAIQMACPTNIEAQFVWDGMELMALLRKNNHGKPALVVLDLNMPRKDGRAVLREIKSDPSLANIPIAVLTTSINDRDEEYCQRYGVIGYYRKPSSMTELRDILSDLCSTYIA